MQIQKGKNAVCSPINMSRKKVTLMVESKFILGSSSFESSRFTCRMRLLTSIQHSKLFGKKCNIIIIITELTENSSNKKQFFLSFRGRQTELSSKTLALKKRYRKKKRHFPGGKHTVRMPAARLYRGRSTLGGFHSK